MLNRTRWRNIWANHGRHGEYRIRDRIIWFYNVPFAKWAVFSPNAAAASRTSAIAISSSGVISSLADDDNDNDEDEWCGFARIIPVMGGAPRVTNATADELIEIVKETRDMMMMMDFIIFPRGRYRNWISVGLILMLARCPMLLLSWLIVIDVASCSQKKIFEMEIRNQ